MDGSRSPIAYNCAKLYLEPKNVFEFGPYFKFTQLASYHHVAFQQASNSTKTSPLYHEKTDMSYFYGLARPAPVSGPRGRSVQAYQPSALNRTTLDANAGTSSPLVRPLRCIPPYEPRRLYDW